MKKLLLIPALLTTMAFASDYHYEITPLIGYNIAEGNLDLANDALIGLEIQFNKVNSIVKPELSILHSGNTNSKDITPSTKTNITRIAINGVREFDKVPTGAIPFLKAGLGYETLSTHFSTNTDSIFLNAGAGVKLPFTQNLALKLEALYMLKENSHTSDAGDSNLALLAGLNYSFGQKAQKVAPAVVVPLTIDGDDDNDGILNSMDKCPGTVAYQKVNAAGCFVDGDDDKDGVLNSIDTCPNTPLGKPVNTKGCYIDNDIDKDGVLNAQDKCPSTPLGKPVNSQGCFIDNDLDKDGVLNTMDKCPSTPIGKTVNTNGCVVSVDNDIDKDGILNINDICPNTPLGQAVNNDGCSKTVKLQVNFGNNSSVIKSNSYAEIESYATFLKKYTNYTARIIGHTDSLGKNSYNQMLSESRAKAVVDMLVKKGAPMSSLSYFGEGEASPIATNTTREGRAENRRIEAELTRK